MELKRPELIILIPRIMQNKHGYFEVRIEYKMAWADLGYPRKNLVEEGREKWYKVRETREFVSLLEVMEMIKNFYDDSKTHPPVILAKSLESLTTSEQLQRAYEEKILQFRSLAVEYWKRHQI